VSSVEPILLEINKSIMSNVCCIAAKQLVPMQKIQKI